MKRLFSWSTWSITTKILVPFLVLTIGVMFVILYVAFSDISGLGDYALQTSTDLGNSAIEDSTASLTSLGESIITQKANDVARQVEMYLSSHPVMTIDEMRADEDLRDIVVQSVGSTGYTTLIDPINAVIIIHRFPGQEKNIATLKSTLPVFWHLIERSRFGSVSGYYDWLETDGRITEKYAAVAPVTADGYELLTLWATTYIEEFSGPAEQTRQNIVAAIDESKDIINEKVASTQRALIIAFGSLVVIVVLLVLVISRALTKPIFSLRYGAGEVGQGNLDYRLPVSGQDELGDLAMAFNRMAADLKSYIDRLKRTAEDNLTKERTIQENLRLYARGISRAQEDERKRIARELHDDTLQSLVVVARHLEELAVGDADVSVAEVREEVRELARSVRRFSQELRPSVLDDLGLIPALKWLAQELQDNFGIEVTIETSGQPQQIDSEKELSLFRVVQEALTNVRKHAEATRASITVSFLDDRIEVTVQDNGQGFDMTAVEQETEAEAKLGLLGMQERAVMIGARVTVDSTTVTVRVPA